MKRTRTVIRKHKRNRELKANVAEVQAGERIADFRTTANESVAGRETDIDYRPAA